jgi:hypothetical protein
MSWLAWLPKEVDILAHHRGSGRRGRPGADRGRSWSSARGTGIVGASSA